MKAPSERGEVLGFYTFRSRRPIRVDAEKREDFGMHTDTVRLNLEMSPELNRLLDDLAIKIHGTKKVAQAYEATTDLREYRR